MTSPLTAPILHDVLRRESRSLLQYTEEAFPYMPAEEQPVWNQLKKLIAEEQQALADLARFLARRRIPPPYIGSFPEGFTALNFASLDHLLPRLVEEQQTSIKALEHDLARLSDVDAAAAVRQYLEAKRHHLQTLQGLAVRQPQATPK